MKKLHLHRNTLLFAFLLMVNWGWGQTTIFSESFDSGSSPFGFGTITGGTTYSGSSASTDRPASSPFYVSSNTAYGVSNGSAALTSGNINTSAYSNISLTLRVAAFSVNSTGNGMDASDNVKVEISPNGGTNYYNTVQINGNSNAYWSYSGGTGNASASYDGDASPVTYAPAGGGSRTSDGYSTITITSLPAASNLKIRITLTDDATNERWVIDDISLTGYTPSIAISSAHPAAGNINSNSTNNIIASIQFDVTTTAATLTGISVTTAGTYSASDIQTNGFKFWINSSNDLSGATQLGSSQAAVSTGGTVAVSGLSQSVPVGTRYVLLTADVSATATGGNTAGITSTPFSTISFSSGTKTGTDPVSASNLQTILSLTPSIAVSAAHPAAGNINYNSTDNIIAGIQFDVTNVAASLTGISVTTAGTYSASDIQTNGFKFWINGSNSLSGATQLGTSQAAVGTGGTIAVSGLSATMPIGTQYVLVTASTSSGATGGNTIGITSTPFTGITFATGTLTGTDPVGASNLQTILTPSVAISAAHPAAGTVNAGTTSNIIGSIQLDVTNSAATLTGISVTTSGTYTTADISTNGFKFWINSSNSTSGATQLGTSQAATGSGGTVAVSGLSQSISSGTTRYLLITADIAATAINGRTIGITSTTFSNITFSNASKTGADPVDASNLQTIFSNAGTTTISAGAGAEPASISSLINTQGAASLNFDIEILDDGSLPSTDNQPTLITQMVFTQGTGNDVANWTLAIAGAELSDGTNSMTGTVAASTITFSGINIADLGLVADDASKTYTLKVWLNSDMSSLKTTIDGMNLVFRIQNSNITTDPSGSKMSASQDQNSGASNNAVDVQATALAFVQNASTTNVSASMSPAVTVSANDANGNRDLGYATTVSITSSGTLSGTPVNATPSSGLATFSSLVHTVAGTGLQLTAASGALSSAASSSFNINDISLSTDYFRTAVSSGSWTSASTWESSHDNSTWITATLTPTSSANAVTIRNGNTITISSTLSIDQVTVEAGGFLDLTAGTLTIANGTGTDLDVYGTFRSALTITISSGATVVFENGGLYKHNFAASGTIPTAAWSTGSTCEINATNNAIPSGFNQTYYNLIWNYSGQTANINASGTLPTINGDFTIVSTGSVTLRLTGNTTPGSAFSIGGKLRIEGGTLDLSSGSGSVTMNLAGNFEMTGGTLTETGTGSHTINFSGAAVRDFIKSGGTIANTINFNVNNGATVDFGTNVLDGSNGTFTVASGGKIKIGSTNGIASTGATGNIQSTGTRTFNAGGIYEYNGGSAQITGTGLPATLSGTLIVNNSNNVSLSSNTTVNGTLSFTSGKLLLGGSNLTIGSSGAITGMNSGNYVATNAAGVLTRNSVTSTSTLFPIGDDTYYTPVTISNGGTTDNFSVTFTSASAPSCLTAGTAVTGTWDISEAVAGGSNCSIIIDYGSVPAGVSFNASEAKIGHCNGSTLDYVSGSVNGTEITGTGFTSFSPFGITNQIVLPIELTTFSATLRNRQTQLDWITASEADNAFFSIERSTDGVEFSAIGKLNGAGTSTQAHMYRFIDEKPAAGINFYRLKQVDFDGKFAYSKVVSVEIGTSGAVTLSPVPVQDQLHVNFGAATVNDAIWQVIDYAGRLVQSGTIPAESYDFSIDVARLVPGAYFLRIVDGKTVTAKAFQK